MNGMESFKSSYPFCKIFLCCVCVKLFGVKLINSRKAVEGRVNNSL